jgi:hypothetical protein
MQNLKNNIDIVIIGGGIQGLILLHQCIIKNKNVVLFTKDNVGDGETLHGHEFINTGFFGNNATSMKQAKSNNEELIKLLVEFDIQPFSDYPCYMVTHLESKDHPLSSNKLMKIWETTGHECHILSEDELPESLKGQKSYQIVKTKDYVLDTKLLTQKLYERYKQYIKKGELIQTKLNSDGTSVKSIAVKTENGDVHINCKKLLLATGAWTTRLLYTTVTCDNDESKSKFLSTIHKQLKCCQVPMVCVTGDDIPALSVVGIALKNKLFSAGAPHVDTQKPVWKSTPLPFNMPLLDETQEFNANIDPEIDPTQVQHTVESFREVFPSFDQMARNFQFSVYYGWKAEHPTNDALPKLQYVTNFGLQNAVSCIPAVWTNIIVAAQEALNQLSIDNLESSEETIDSLSNLPGASMGTLKYQKIEWIDWNTFTDRYMIKSSL